MSRFVVRWSIELTRVLQTHSIISHSMGALIARAALTEPVMMPYLSKMHTFVSLSGAHLGTQYSGNTVVEGGTSQPTHTHVSALNWWC